MPPKKNPVDAAVEAALRLRDGRHRQLLDRPAVDAVLRKAAQDKNTSKTTSEEQWRDFKIGDVPFSALRKDVRRALRRIYTAHMEQHEEEAQGAARL